MSSNNTISIMILVAAILAFTLIGWEATTALRGYEPVVFKPFEQDTRYSLYAVIGASVLMIVMCLWVIVSVLRLDKRNGNANG